jgi:hypothetical protein
MEKKQVQEFKEYCFFKTGQPLRTRNCRSGLLTDLAASDNFLFPILKKHLKGKKFLSIEENTLAADGWFTAKTKEFFWKGLKKLEQQS